MTITEEQAEKMKELAKPLQDWLEQNCHPHCTITLDSQEVELHESIARSVRK